MPDLNSSSPDPTPAVSFTALVGFVLKALFMAAGDFFRFIGRHKILIITFCCFGIGYGIFQYKVSPRYYKLKMIVRHTELNNSIYAQILDNLNLMAESGSYASLGSTLKVDSGTALNVLSITSINVEGIDLRKDTTTTNEGMFIIQCNIKDTRIADTLEKALVNYFNTNAFLSKLKGDKFQVRQERLQFMDGELRKMDSLKDAYTKALGAGKALPSGNNSETSPADVFKESDLLSTQRALLQEWMFQGKNSVVAVDGFKPTVAPASLSIRSQILLNLLIFFLLSTLLAGILEFQKTKKE